MKNYNKIILGILLLLTVVTSVGCNSISAYQNSIFNDESKIVKQADSYTYVKRLGQTIDKESNIKFNSFTGMDTIFNITVDESSDVIINFDSTVDKGDFKVVLISPDDEITNILTGTNQGNETITLKKGKSRVKLIGKKASGEIKINIDSKDGVKVKGIKR